MSEFTERGTEVLAVSTDSKFSHKAWLETPRKKVGIEGCQYPVLADFTKKVTADYGVLNEEMGVAERGLFIIDPEGVVQGILITNLSTGRNVDEVLRQVDASQYEKENGVVCPIGWTKGQEAINPAKAGEWFEKNA